MNQIAQWTRAWAVRAGLECWHQEQTASTNDIAKSQADGSGMRSPLAPVLYLTDHQTAGRGRGSNTWSDTNGALLSSWSLSAQKSPQPILSPLAGLAVYRAATAIWPSLEWSIKAPNDIYLGDKKVAGLLIETIDDGKSKRAIIGLGFNVLSAPRDVATATSLADALGKTALTEEAWSKFLQKLLLSFISGLNAGQSSSLLASDGNALKDALNKRASLVDKVQKVGPQGELHTDKGVIRWQDL